MTTRQMEIMAKKIRTSKVDLSVVNGVLLAEVQVDRRHLSFDYKYLIKHLK